jgi:hypothetical protein
MNLRGIQDLLRFVGLAVRPEHVRQMKLGQTSDLGILVLVDNFLEQRLRLGGVLAAERLQT